MKIGIRLHDTAPGTLPERLSFAKAQGFCCAHLALSKAVEGFRMEDAPERLNEALAAEVRDAFAQNGMEQAVLGCYLNLADPNPERRARTQKIYQAHLRFAAMTGASVVGTETFANPESHFAEAPAQSEEAFRLFMDSLRTVVRYAEEAGAVLAVEPVHHHIISTPARAARMLEELPSPNLKIILDAVNLVGPKDAENPAPLFEEAIRLLGDQVRILHMKDYVIQPDGSTKSCACGLGCMRYERLLSSAKERELPMTLEDTRPDNAEQARLHLEAIARTL